MSRNFLLSSITELVRPLDGRAFPVRAPAKLNLCLEVKGRRDDGYHLLEMLNCTAGLADEIGLWFTVDPVLELTVDPARAEVGPGADNLVFKALREFWAAFGFEQLPHGMRAHLSKRIPIGAGLGGGSSDAAAVLRTLTGVFAPLIVRELSLGVSDVNARVMSAALRCGADVPYAYVGGPCIVSGVGETVSPLVGKSIWNESVLVVSPAAAVNTRQFYDFYRSRVSTFHRAGEVPLIERVRRASDVRDLVHNDFEQAVCEFAPEVGRCLDIVRRHVPRGSAVTGSGAAIFALVENRARSTMAVLEQELGARGAGVCRTTLM